MASPEPIIDKLEKPVVVRLYTRRDRFLYFLKTLGLLLFLVYCGLILGSPDTLGGWQGLNRWILLLTIVAFVITVAGRTYYYLQLRRFDHLRVVLEEDFLVWGGKDRRIIPWRGGFERIYLNFFSWLVFQTPDYVFRLPLTITRNRAELLTALQISGKRKITLHRAFHFIWIKIFLPLVFAAHIKIFLIAPMEVTGPSMEPLLKNGQMVFINKLPAGFRLPPIHLGEFLEWPGSRWPATGWRAPERGEVIVFRHPLSLTPVYPEGEPHFVIKRVIAVGGDHYRIAGGHVFLNGEKLAEPYLTGGKEGSTRVDWRKTLGRDLSRYTPPILRNLGPAATRAFEQGSGTSGRVPPGMLLVLGDNRNYSVDSRHRAVGFIPHTLVSGYPILLD